MTQRKRKATMPTASAVSLELEQFEPRLLFSADNPFALGAALLGGSAMGPTPVPPAITQIDRLTENNRESAAWQLSNANAVLSSDEDGGQFTEQRRSVGKVIFVDSRVPEIDNWLTEVSANTDESKVIHILNAQQDGLLQMSQQLAHFTDVSEVHVITHADTGSMLAGSDEISHIDLLVQADTLLGWRHALATGADVLIYGCNLADDAAGRQWVSTFGQMTGADVAASDDLTGESALGADCRFDVAGTILLSTALPDITTAVQFNGHTVPGYADEPLVVIDGSSLAAGNGINLVNGSQGSIVRALQIVNFPGNGIAITNTADISLSSNYIGTNGVNALSNGNAAVWVSASDSITIGGSSSDFANVLSGNSYGVVLEGVTTVGVDISANIIGLDAAAAYAIENRASGILVNDQASNITIGGADISSGNVISGNRESGISIVGIGTQDVRVLSNTIGLNQSGFYDIPNRIHGVEVGNSASNITIGLAASGNVISGNGQDGVHITNLATDIRMQGNAIGTDSNRTISLGNADDGVSIQNGATVVTVGGDRLLGEGNIISGNSGAGIYVAGMATRTVNIEGNIIGLDQSMNFRLQNMDGIRVLNARDVVVGGLGGFGNVIGGNRFNGIVVEGVSTGQIDIVGNRIGTDSVGANDYGNTLHGIAIDSPGVQVSIGGSASGLGNVISGNNGAGIVVTAATNAAINGNFIGTSASGESGLGNALDGISLSNISGSVAIGDQSSNIVAANGGNGLSFGAGIDDAVIINNLIGVSLNGLVALGNAGNGVVLSGSGNRLGGAASTERNIIANNMLSGVVVDLAASNNNSLLGNVIRDNTGLSIDLGSDGRDTNDLNDVDVGANEHANYPVLQQAQIETVGTIRITGELNASNLPPNYRIEFFVSSSSGQADRFIGSTSLTNNATGIVPIDVTLPALIGAGQYITATATAELGGLGSFGSTSELSASVQAITLAAAPVITSSANLSVDEGETDIATITAIDVDGPSLSYSITGGNDASLFSIDSLTGALSFDVAQNFENAVDSDADGFYEVMVSVSDGALTDTENFVVTVNNVNEAPELVAAAPFSVAENTTNVSGSFAASDPDGDNLSYSLLATPDAAPFSINSATGAITLNTALDFENPSDANADNAYDLTVQVTDGALTASTNIQLMVTNVSDTNRAPTLEIGTPFSVVENSTTVSGAFITSDPDADVLTFSLLASPDMPLFGINSSTGELTIGTAPNFETPNDANGDGQYELQVQVSDGEFTASTNVVVSIIDVADTNQAPVISVITPFSVTENSSIVNGAFATNDADGDALVYSLLAGPDARVFEINSATGALQLSEMADYENPTDANNDGVYDLTVQVSDGMQTANVSFGVTVVDINEAPIVTLETPFVALELQPSLTGALDARDPEGNALTFALLSTTDSAFFQIDPATGELHLLAPIDFENPGDADADNRYELTVAASDGQVTTEFDFLVVNNDVNEAPIVDAVDIEGVANTLTTVAALPWQDPDVGDSVEFSIVGGSAQRAFTTNPVTGDIEQVENLSAGSYTLQIEARDTRGLASTVMLQVTIEADPEANAETVEATQELLSTAFNGRDDLNGLSRDTGNSGETRGSNRAAIAPRVFGQRMVIDILLDDLNDSAQNLAAVFDIDIDPSDISIVYSTAMLEALDDLRDTFEDEEERSANQESLIVKAGTIASATMTVGFVTWVLRTGALIATAYSTSPLWRSIDPIPVLNDLRSLHDDDIESPFYGMNESSNESQR